MSAPTILASWAVGHPTSTALPKKARRSPTGAGSRTARPATRGLHHGAVALRADPFERGDETALYDKWMIDRVFVQASAKLGRPMAAIVSGFSHPTEAGFLQS